jgi:hypothetical protein
MREASLDTATSARNAQAGAMGGRVRWYTNHALLPVISPVMGAQGCSGLRLSQGQTCIAAETGQHRVGLCEVDGNRILEVEHAPASSDGDSSRAALESWIRRFGWLSRTPTRATPPRRNSAPSLPPRTHRIPLRESHDSRCRNRLDRPPSAPMSSMSGNRLRSALTSPSWAALQNESAATNRKTATSKYSAVGPCVLRHSA